MAAATITTQPSGERRPVDSNNPNNHPNKSLPHQVKEWFEHHLPLTRKLSPGAEGVVRPTQPREWRQDKSRDEEKGSNHVSTMEAPPGAPPPPVPALGQSGPKWRAGLHIRTIPSSSSSPLWLGTDDGHNEEEEEEGEGWVVKRSRAGRRRPGQVKSRLDQWSLPAAAPCDGSPPVVTMVTFKQGGKGEYVVARGDEDHPLTSPILLDRLGGCDDICLVLSDGSTHHLAGSTVLSLLTPLPAPVEVEVGEGQWRIKCRLETCHQPPRSHPSNWSVLVQPIMEGQRDGAVAIALGIMSLPVFGPTPALRFCLLAVASFILLASYLERQSVFNPDDTLWSWDLYILQIQRASKAQEREERRQRRRRRQGGWWSLSPDDKEEGEEAFLSPARATSPGVDLEEVAFRLEDRHAYSSPSSCEDLMASIFREEEGQQEQEEDPAIIRRAHQKLPASCRLEPAAS